MKKQILFLILFVSLISCSRVRIYELDDVARRDTGKFTQYNNYTRGLSLKLQGEYMERKDFSNSLRQCRAYNQLFVSRINPLVSYRTFFSTLLRYPKKKNMTITELFDNNVFLLEAIEVIQDRTYLIDIDDKAIFLNILNSGIQNPEAFVAFLECLSEKVSFELGTQKQKKTRSFFSTLESRYPRWYIAYNIERLDKTNFSIK